MNNKKIDNKIYNSIEPDDKFSKTVLEECLSKIKNNPLPDDEISLRRIEKMKKKGRISKILKTSVAASFAIIATAGIIFGVNRYRKDGKMVKKVNKESTEYSQLFTHDYTGEEIKIGDYYFKLHPDASEMENGDTCNVYFKKKKDEKYKGIPNVNAYDFLEDIFTNGKYLYYSGDCLHRYNMETNECENFPIVCKEIPEEKCSNESFKIQAIKDGYIYLNYGYYEEYQNNSGSVLPELYIVAYNIQSGKISLLENMEVYLNFDDYLIINDYNGVSEFKSFNTSSKVTVYKTTKNGPEKIYSFGSNSMICFNCNAEDKEHVQYELNNKFYFEEETDTGKKLSSLDKKTGEVKLVADMKHTDFGEQTSSCINIESVMEDYCLISIYDNRVKGMVFYKYMYDEKKVIKVDGGQFK